MTQPKYRIVIPRWDGADGFQHYKDRDPKWIKVYTRLNSDDDYFELSYHLRGVLLGIWLEYARSGRQLTGTPLALGRRLGHRITTQDLKRLNQAGFIELSLADRYQTASPEQNRLETETSAVHKDHVQDFLNETEARAQQHRTANIIDLELRRAADVG